MSTDDLPDQRVFERNRPEHVCALASRVISVLRTRQGDAQDGVRQFVLDHLFRALLSKGAVNVVELAEDLRAHRLTIDIIIDLYIPRAATMLGQKWQQDEITFAQVTIGTLRLQSLLSEISAATRSDMCSDQNRLRTLIVVPQGEQHFLGANVVGAQLRRIGCEVSISFDERQEDLGRRMKFDPPDLVLITCSRVENLENVRRTVQVLRPELKEGPMIALGGAVTGSEKNLKDQTGVDIVTSSASEAVAFCAKSAKALARK